MGGKTSTASKRKWNNANYEYTQLVTQKGEKELIKQAAQNAGQSVNAYILQAVKTRMEQEGQQTAPTEQEQTEQWTGGYFHFPGGDWLQRSGQYIPIFHPRSKNPAEQGDYLVQG